MNVMAAWPSSRCRAVRAMAVGLMPLLAFGIVPGRALAVSTAAQVYAQALQSTPNMDRGAQLFEQCVRCHGRDGAGSSDGSIPVIAGQWPSVLIRQLIEFRYDVRHNILVQGFISRDAPAPQDLADVAAYVSLLPPPAPMAANAPEVQAQVAFGRLCATCHGLAGQGDAATDTPQLAGQHREYLAAQLREALSGGRPDMQQHVNTLSQLTSEDMDAIAAYLAGMPPRGAVATREPDRSRRAPRVP